MTKFKCLQVSVKTKMAIVCMRCKMLVIFLYIFTLLGATSSQEYFHYDIESNPYSDLVSLVLKDEHLLSKRDITKKDEVESLQVLTNLQSTNQITTGANPPISNNQKPAYNAEETTTPANVSTTTAKPNSTLQLNHNVGVNGTGQRWDVTPKPPEVVAVMNISSTTEEEVPTSTMSNVAGHEDDIDVAGHEDDIAVSHHSDDIMNKTAEENHLKTEVDNHEYYKSTFTVDPHIGEKYWVDMTNNSKVKTNELLSQSHRRAATVKLSFDFPFYGHVVRNVTIATGGFLYTGEYVHSWLAATQYIAPLMANFDTSLSNDSYIRYVDNGTAFTVQWEKVCLQDKPNGGVFTFQATLHDNGDIVFVYQHVPVDIDLIQDEHHPVKVGLSDAYIIDRTIFFVRRKTIYEYHRVHFNREDIKNWTVIYLNALPTCLINKDCVSCLTKKTSNFECTWCPSSSRCSNGMDRHRQDWLIKGCEHKQFKNESQCSLPIDRDSSYQIDGTSSHYDTDMSPEHHPEMVDDPKQASRINDVNVRHSEKSVSIGISGVVTILFIVGLMTGLAMWVLYAYRNPHSASGQMLIRYRPSQWSWKRGEARYTAATIHM